MDQTKQIKKDKSKSDLAQDLFDLYYQSKKLAKEYNDWGIYKDFLEDCKIQWTKQYAEMKTDEGRALLATLIKTTNKEHKWVLEKLREEKIPF